MPFVQTAGPALERKGDVAAFLTSLEPRSVFFIDEIHRLPRAVEEIFYPAMEDRQLPITVGQGAGARVMTLPLPPFTLVGATTRAGLLTTPLRDRFGIQHRLDHYDPAELARIVVRSARVLDVEIDAAGARTIAERSRGTPRVANRLLKRVRDFAQVRGTGAIDVATADAALEMLGVDDIGLDRLDRVLLQAICGHFGGGPVGLSTLAVTVAEEADTIEDVYEPYLLQRGFIQRTPRGRMRDAARLPRTSGSAPSPPRRSSEPRRGSVPAHAGPGSRSVSVCAGEAAGSRAVAPRRDARASTVRRSDRSTDAARCRSDRNPVRSVMHPGGRSARPATLRALHLPSGRVPAHPPGLTRGAEAARAVRTTVSRT